MPARPDDGQLIAKLQSGDLDALGVLYERHKMSVYRTALTITHDPSAADDILQDCFLRLHRYAHSVDSSLPLRPWLYRVTVNLAYNWARRGKCSQTSLNDVMYRLVSPPYCSPEWQAERNDVRSKVMDAISSLEIKHRVVIVLFYLNSLSVNEIALILNCPAGTVKSRLHYGREKLRHRLEAKPTTPSRATTLRAAYGVA